MDSMCLYGGSSNGFWQFCFFVGCLFEEEYEE